MGLFPHPPRDRRRHAGARRKVAGPGDVNLRSLTDLFVQPVQYEIPRFQRPYVWNRDRQWVPLWVDVQHTAERILAAESEGAPQPQPHFMGAVVFQQIPNVTGSLTRRIVVDGQQRLTTLQLLLDAAQEVFEGSGIAAPAARLEALVLNQAAFCGARADNAFKVWPTDADQAPFRRAMTNDLSSAEWADSRVVEAHQFFRDQIEQWLGEGEEGLD